MQGPPTRDNQVPAQTAIPDPSPAWIVGGIAGIVVNTGGPGGRLVVQFTRTNGPSTANSLPVPAVSGDQVIVYSSGPWQVGTPGLPTYHDQTRAPGAQAVNFATGTQSSQVIPVPDKKKAHGALMGLGWGFILPLGFLIARHLRFIFGQTKLFGLDTWFVFHVAFQWTGLILTTAGFAIGINDIGTNLYKSHRILGSSIMALGYFQPFNAHLRNAIGAHIEKGQPKSTMRIAWEYVHKNVGRAACIMAVAQIFMGFDILKYQYPDGLDAGYRHAYSVGVAVIGSLFLVFEFKRILFGVGGGGSAGAGPPAVATSTEMQRS